MSDCSSGDAIVELISSQGWLQVDLVPGDALAAFIPEAVLEEQFGGKLPTYWALASHSCTVHARNYDDAPTVEWVACKLVKKKAYNKCLNALNPRKLHLPLGEKQHLELKIQRRIWTPRSALPELNRIDVGLDESSKETFAYWMGHSYTRIAMPDKLVERLRFSDDTPAVVGLGVQVDQFIQEKGDWLHSAWVSFEPKDELLDPTEPYAISFRFLIKNQHKRSLHEAQLRLEALLQAASPLGAGLTFDGAEVGPLQDFTMLDAEAYTRYNIHDWLSLGDSDPDDEGEE